MTFHCPLDYIVSDEKSAVILIFVPSFLCLPWFSLSLFPYFEYDMLKKNNPAWIMWIILLWSFWICDLIPFIGFVKFSAINASHMASTLFSLFPLGFQLHVYRLHCLKYFSNFPLLSLSSVLLSSLLLFLPFFLLLSLPLLQILKA